MRLILVLLSGLLVVPAALAAPRASGDGVFELKDVDASRIVITGTRGAIWGQLDSGTLRVSDLNLDDNLAPLVSCTQCTYTQSATDPSAKTYTGRNIHFRFSGGRYRFTVTSAVSVDVTAVGVGQVWLTGDPYSFDPGYYAVDDGKWQSVPLVKKQVTFGVQPIAPTP